MSSRRCLAIACAAALSACGSAMPSTPAAPSPTPTPAPAPAPTPPPLDGRYEIRFDADAACGDLPEAARSRTYIANINSYPVITLQGEHFGPPFGGYAWNVIYQSVHGESETLFFQDPEIWELLSPESYVVIFGDATGVIDRNRSVLAVTADVRFCAARDQDDAYPECEVPEIVCRSNRHTLTLTRQ